MMSFFPSVRAALMCGSVMAAGIWAGAQQTSPLTTPTTIPAVTQAAPADADPNSSTSPRTKAPDTVPTPNQPSVTGSTTTSGGTTTVTASKTFTRGKKKEDKVVASKDTKKELNRVKKADVLIGQDSKLPDKQLYDKALTAMKKGHFDVARLDLQTMLNTYPDSQYQMRAKLAIADTWYKEGGTAALTQAESEYADFRVFFPNVPEAAEAQMRIGDIYFRQMDKPDRDYSKSMHAEEEYRRMLTDYPDSQLVPQAKQRLREVQEILATRESDIAGYYATRENYAAVIARDQTVIDTYPLYSHMDDVLIGLGDAYEAEARYLRGLKLPEAGKAKLETLYDGQAADAYRKVVLEHSASAHVEDARDRLAAMNLPIPTPTKEQVAASEALENSRATYRLADRVSVFVLHKPDVVTAARMGDPTMVDPKATVAPTVVAKVKTDFNDAFLGANAPVAVALGPKAAEDEKAAAPPVATAPVAAVPAAPLAFTPVPDASEAAPTGATSSFSTTAPANGGGRVGNGIGVEIVQPGSRPTSTANDTPGGLTAVGPANAAPLPEAEKATAAPDRPNEVNAAASPAAQAAAANGKKPASTYDKKEESSSKHPKKKGLKKVVEPL